MSGKLYLEQIRAFWTSQAEQHRQSPAASWSDRRAIEKEIAEITARLGDGDTVLDIGCANGFSTMQFAANKHVRVRGLDYIEKMVEQARLRAEAFPHELAGSVEFAQGDITELKEPDGAYDKVVVTRVIINLGSWEHQLAGLREAARVVKSGGELLLSEATLQGWNRLNALRREWGLPDIPMPSFNTYLDQDRVVEALSEELELQELVDFASTYYVGTRLLKPLLIQALGADIDPADPEMEWNRWFASLPAWGDYGVQKLFVFRKR